MSRSLPTVNWFELEVLSSIAEEEKYGQQLLKELSAELSEKVSSGRLYPVLQKLEKNEYIEKSEQEKGRFFYTLTRKGKMEIDRANQWSLRSVMDALVGKLVTELSEHITGKLEQDLGSENRQGKQIFRIASVKFPPSEVFKAKRFNLVERYILDQPGVELYNIRIDRGDGREHRSPSFLKGDPLQDLTEMNGEFGDFPLKDAYVDIVLLGDTYLQAPDRDAHMQEILRILKPGGKLYFTVVAKYNSYIMESLTELIQASAGGQFRPSKGMDESEVRAFLGSCLGDVRLEQVKELFISTGRKPE